MDAFISILKDFGLTFVPIFVAMDAIGIIPILLPITGGLDKKERNKITRLAMLTALILGLAFVIIGNGIFQFMGIMPADFLVGGGLILFILAANQLVTGKWMTDKEAVGSEMVGVVPLGTPLIVGPAVLATLIILTQQYALWIVIVSFLVNLGIALVIFAQANRVAGFLGQSGIKAMSKIIALFLAAIAVKMVREGILQVLK
jgi:multiple antibiotic resistance protein